MLLILALPGCDTRQAEPKKSPIVEKLKTQNVLLVTTDGLRWQEVFGGADSVLMDKKNGGVRDVLALRGEFERGTPEDRREALMPFVWGVIAKKGQLFGNANAGSVARVTNGRNFSYPGYNEIFTGAADPRIDSNNKFPNRNVTVLEWLNRVDGFQDRVAAFGSWDVFPYILNRIRSKLPIVAGWEPLRGERLTDEERMLNRLIAGTHRVWPDNCYDSFTFNAALEYLKRDRPRVLYIGMGETDEFGHAGRYDHYLHSAHQVDEHLRTLWETVQSLAEYRNKTTMIVTTDHGRGNAPDEWKSHGAEIAGSDKIWIAIMGPDTPALGERTHIAEVTQSQIAATLTVVLGLDYRAFSPKAAPPIASALASGLVRD
jgi:Metalloenzyme superfamily